MTLNVDTHPIPLRLDADGDWRVGQTRVLLDLVIHAFNAGRTPEEIVQSYNTLPLEDVYAVIAYYLRHQFEVDAYIRHRQQESDKLWVEIEANTDIQAFRQRLLERARRTASNSPHTT
ncbi:MAG: DUF433 domain-containing protein [Chloroflexi bacterium]|nr:DUF433 domain-containing protein [Chloroflexota bacterium]